AAGRWYGVASVSVGAITGLSLAVGSSTTRHSPTLPFPVREKAKSSGASPGFIAERSICVVALCVEEVGVIKTSPIASARTTARANVRRNGCSGNDICVLLYRIIRAYPISPEKWRTTPAAEQTASVWIVPALKRKIATIAATDRISAQRFTLASTGASNETPKPWTGKVSRKIV